MTAMMVRFQNSGRRGCAPFRRAAAMLRRLAVGCLLLPLAAGHAPACTLWGEAGTNAGGGTIISKNRDWEPDHKQVLKMHRSSQGYAYFGLYAEGGEAPGLKDGVNEKGLTAVTASASSLPKEMREEQPGQHGVLGTLLAGYATCDEVLAKQETIFPKCRAGFIMISDRKKILVVETGLHGRYAIRTVENGPATHTNHYLEKSLDEFNVKIGAGSATRLGRISELLSASPAPCDTSVFAALSRDQHDGPNSSLWRTGKDVRTLSSWIVETPAQGAPKLRVALANPGETETTNTFVLDEKFWKEGPPLERN
jgi:isopenicillin-N N-acyltransferase like protein